MLGFLKAHAAVFSEPRRPDAITAAQNHCLDPLPKGFIVILELTVGWIVHTQQYTERMVDVLSVADHIQCPLVASQITERAHFNLGKVNHDELVACLRLNHVPEIDSEHFFPRQVLQVEVAAAAAETGSWVRSTIHESTVVAIVRHRAVIERL